MRLTRLLLGLVLVGAPITVGTRPAHAQATAPAGGGPRVEELRVGYAPAEPAAAATAEVAAAAKGPFGSRANGRVAAIVGGAALVGGLLIGDDAGTVIAVTGLVVGLLGLWTWLG
jgi:hypothetical protein